MKTRCRAQDRKNTNQLELREVTKTDPTGTLPENNEDRTEKE
jgi:hypothetical protein